MESAEEKTWKEKLSEIPPQKSFSGLLRELNELGVDISYNGLKKQNDKHGIVKKGDGFFEESEPERKQFYPASAV